MEKSEQDEILNKFQRQMGNIEMEYLKFKTIQEINDYFTENKESCRNFIINQLKFDFACCSGDIFTERIFVCQEDCNFIVSIQDGKIEDVIAFSEELKETYYYKNKMETVLNNVFG